MNKLLDTDMDIDKDIEMGTDTDTDMDINMDMNIDTRHGHVVQLCGLRDIVSRFEVIELNCLQDSIVEQGSNIDSASKSNPLKRSSHNVQPDHLTKSTDQTIIGRLLLRSFAYLWLYFV